MFGVELDLIVPETRTVHFGVKGNDVLRLLTIVHDRMRIDDRRNEVKFIHITELEFIVWHEGKAIGSLHVKKGMVETQLQGVEIW